MPIIRVAHQSVDVYSFNSLKLITTIRFRNDQTLVLLKDAVVARLTELNLASFTRWYYGNAFTKQFTEIDHVSIHQKFEELEHSDIFLETDDQKHVVGLKREREELQAQPSSSLRALMEYPVEELARMCLEATKASTDATKAASVASAKAEEYEIRLAKIDAEHHELLKSHMQTLKQLKESQESAVAAKKKVKESAIAVALMEHAEEPLKVLWDVLIDRSYEGPAAAMSVINDPRCGIKVRGRHELSGIKHSNTRFPSPLTWIFASPLGLAIFAQRLDVIKAIVRVIVASGAEIFTVLDENHVVICAAKVGNADILKYLLSLGANPRQGDALMHAAIRGHADCIQCLVAFEHVDKQDSDFHNNMTALHYAAGEGSASTVEVLLMNNARIDIKCKRGMLALDYARKSGDAETIRILEEAAQNSID